MQPRPSNLGASKALPTYKPVFSLATNKLVSSLATNKPVSSLATNKLQSSLVVNKLEDIQLPSLSYQLLTPSKFNTKLITQLFNTYITLVQIKIQVTYKNPNAPSSNTTKQAIIYFSLANLARLITIKELILGNNKRYLEDNISILSIVAIDSIY